MRNWARKIFVTPWVKLRSRWWTWRNRRLLALYNTEEKWKHLGEDEH